MKASEGCEASWLWAGTERGVAASASGGDAGMVAELNAEVNVWAIVSLTVPECVSGQSFRHGFAARNPSTMRVIGSLWRKLMSVFEAEVPECLEAT
jgi:hypothetical protein